MRISFDKKTGFVCAAYQSRLFTPALALLIATLSYCLVSCSPSRPSVQKQEILLTTSQECDHTLNLLEDNIRSLQMLTNDVVDNVDAIIAIEEANADIIKAIDENPQALSETQRQRYNSLLEEYKKHTGD